MDGFDVVKKSPAPFSSLVILYKATPITNILQLVQRNLLFVNNKTNPVPNTVNPSFAFSMILCIFSWFQPNTHKKNITYSHTLCFSALLSQNFHFIFLLLTAEFVQVYLCVIVFFSDLLFVSGMAMLATSHCNLHELKDVVVKPVLEQMSVGLKGRDIKFQVINHSR